MAVARHVSIPKLKPIQLLVLANMYPSQRAAQDADPNGGWTLNEQVRNAIFLEYQRHPVQDITDLVSGGIIEAVVPGSAPNVPADAIRISASVMEQWSVIKKQIRAVKPNEWPTRRPYQAEAAAQSGSSVLAFTAAAFDPRADDTAPPAPKAAAPAPTLPTLPPGPEPAGAAKTRAGRARQAVNAALTGTTDKDTQADIARLTGNSED